MNVNINLNDIRKKVKKLASKGADWVEDHPNATIAGGALAFFAIETACLVVSGRKANTKKVKAIEKVLSTAEIVVVDKGVVKI